MFGRYSQWIAKAHAAVGSPTFVYSFRRVPTSPSQTAGAYHAAEVPFVRAQTGIDALDPRDDGDHKLGALMRAHWATFAAKGDPSLPHAVWSPYIDAAGPQMIFHK